MRKSNVRCLSVLFALLLFIVNANELYGFSKSKACDVVVTDLLRVCGPGTSISGAVPQICGEVDIHVSMDENCVDKVPLTVFLTNISSNPQYGITYDLPTGVKPIHMRYEYSPGNWVVTDELEEVTYKGMANGIPLYGIDVVLPTEITSDVGCPTGQYKVVMHELNLELVTPGLVSGVPGYVLYPLLEQAKFDSGVFSCEIFKETNCACDVNNYCDPTDSEHLPVYDFDICIECSCGVKAMMSGNSGAINFAETNSFTHNDFEVSPNPFNDLVQVKTISPDGKGEVHISIFDAMGKNVHDQESPAIKGQNNFEINTSLLPDGVYYFIVDNGIQSHTEKMILIRN